MSETESKESMLRRIGATLAVLGVGMYAYLTYLYQRFYTGLDVTPSDVGYTYASTLARSTGLIIAGLVTFMGVMGLRLLPNRLLASLIDDIGCFGVLIIAAALWLAVPFILYPVTEPAREADIAARLVRVGLPVAPVRLYGFTIMDFRADSVHIEVNGKPGASPAADALATRRDLIYLGRTEGVVILFDPAADQPIHIPANAVIIRLQRPVARNGRSPTCVLNPTIREPWQRTLEETLIGWLEPLRRWLVPRC